MARPIHPKQTEAQQFIRECLEAHGDNGGNVARVRYLDIAQQTWSRWVRAVKAEMTMVMNPAPVTASVPAQATRPVTLSGEPIDPSMAPLDFFEGELSRMRQAIEHLHAHATVVDAQGQVRLRNPVMLVQAVRLRAQMLEIFLKKNDTAVGAERIAQYKELLTTTIKHVLGTARNEHELVIMNRLNNALNDATQQWKAVEQIVDPRKAAAAAEAST